MDSYPKKSKLPKITMICNINVISKNLLNKDLLSDNHRRKLNFFGVFSVQFSY